MAHTVINRLDRPLSDRQRHYPKAARPVGSLSMLPTSGEPIPAAVRTFFETWLKQDFGHVRIHQGQQAARLAQAQQARALTYGQDIVFAEDQYQPVSRQGKRLLAHELTHVMQQGQRGRAGDISPAPLSIQRETADPAETQDNPCAGWESDRESFTKRVAEYYVIDALGTVGRGISINCIQNNTLCIWTLQTPNGIISVAVSLAQMSGRVIARQVYVPGGLRCEYDYSCTPKGELIITRHKCQ